MTTTTLAPDICRVHWRCDACGRTDVSELALCSGVPPHIAPSNVAALCHPCMVSGRAYAALAGGRLIPGMFYTRERLEGRYA